MAYVINGGDKPSAKFHHFVDLCCQAFNVVRKHGNLILHLFGLVSLFFHLILLYNNTDIFIYNTFIFKLDSVVI